jgi:hypothetical protein
MEVSNEAKNVIALKFLRKIKKIFFPLVNSIRGHTVDNKYLFELYIFLLSEVVFL